MQTLEAIGSGVPVEQTGSALKQLCVKPSLGALVSRAPRAQARVAVAR